MMSLFTRDDVIVLQAADDGDNSLQFDEFATLFQQLSERPEVHRLFTL